MASSSSAQTIAARNARLDALNSAVQAWGNSQTTALNNLVTSAETILKGRTGSERLAQATVDATSNLVVAQINDFLTGG